VRPCSRFPTSASASEGTDKGRQFPDIVYHTADGSQKSVVASRSKVALVYLWASWCPICLKDLTNIQAHYDKYKSSAKFDAIVLNFMEPYEIGVAWARQHDYKLPFADSRILGRSPAALTSTGTYQLRKWTPLFTFSIQMGIVAEAMAAKSNTGSNIDPLIAKLIESAA
jgi:thiol-disulfide isomerase/thioredoxin